MSGTVQLWAEQVLSILSTPPCSVQKPDLLLEPGHSCTGRGQSDTKADTHLQALMVNGPNSSSSLPDLQPLPPVALSPLPYSSLGFPQT